MSRKAIVAWYSLIVVVGFLEDQKGFTKTSVYYHRLMPSTRRSILRALGGVLLMPIVGCLGSTQFDPEDHVEDWHDEPIRGQGDPIEEEQTVDSLNVGIEEQCSWEAENAVERAVMERANSPPAVHIDYTKTTELPDAGWVVLVQRVVVLGPTGKVKQIPQILFNDLLAVTPPTVSMTIESENKEYSCRYAVYTSDTYQQMD